MYCDELPLLLSACASLLYRAEYFAYNEGGGIFAIFLAATTLECNVRHAVRHLHARQS